MSHEHRGRVSRPRITLGVAWLGAITVTCIGAIDHRSEFADVGSAAAIILVLFGIPAIALAVAAIRTPTILIAAAILSGTWTCVTSWQTLRATTIR